MTLSVDIKYKSNGQQAAAKGLIFYLIMFQEPILIQPVIAKRRNKWLCALKTALAEVKIFGPSGNPHAPPEVSRYTEVPWSIVHASDQRVGENESETTDRVLGTQQGHLSSDDGHLYVFINFINCLQITHLTIWL